MSETPQTPDTDESASRSHLKAVRETASEPAPAQGGPARQGGGHMTGLLALLLAVAVFAFLAQFSNTRQLETRNAALQEALATSQAELAEARSQMTEARDAVTGLRDVLERIETLLAPPAAEGAGASGAGEGAGEAAAEAGAPAAE